MTTIFSYLEIIFHFFNCMDDYRALVDFYDTCCILSEARTEELRYSDYLDDKHPYIPKYKDTSLPMLYYLNFTSAIELIFLHAFKIRIPLFWVVTIVDLFHVSIMCIIIRLIFYFQDNVLRKHGLYKDISLTNKLCYMHSRWIYNPIFLHIV